MSNDTLTVMQLDFILNYLADPEHNQTNAAIKAGCPVKSAHVQASRWLKIPKIQAELKKRGTKVANRLELDANWVLKRLMILADYDVRKFYNADGSLKPVSELDDETAYALMGMEVEEAYQHFGGGQAKPTGQLKKIKYADKGIALERLGRSLKLFTDKIEVTGLESLAERINKIRARKNGRS